MLGYRGYRMVASEDVTALCPQRWCPGAPSSSPDTLKALAGGRPQRIRRWIGRIRRGPPTFYVKHTLLPHVPYMYLPSGRRTRNGVRDPIPGMNGEDGFGDSFLTRHNEQRFLLQLGFVDRQLGALIRRLRRAGLYDRALIVVTADHGGSFETGVSSRRKVTLRQRRRGRAGAAVREAPGPEARPHQPGAGAHPGRDAHDRRRDQRPDPLHRRRPLRLRARGPGAPVRAPAHAQLQPHGSDLAAARGRSAGARWCAGACAATAPGDLASLYTGIGPYRGLIGEQLAELDPAPAGRVRADFVAGRRLRRVRPESGLVPTQLAGTIRGGRPGSRRNLAVAVNGTVRAVGRTWRLRGQRQERFALNLPEAALLRGRNRVVLMEVRRGGKALRVLGRI